MNQKDDLISRKSASDTADKIIDRDKSGNNDVGKAMSAWKVMLELLGSMCKDIERTEQH